MVSDFVCAFILGVEAVYADHGNCYVVVWLPPRRGGQGESCPWVGTDDRTIQRGASSYDRAVSSENAPVSRVPAVRARTTTRNRWSPGGRAPGEGVGSKAVVNFLVIFTTDAPVSNVFTYTRPDLLYYTIV